MPFNSSIFLAFMLVVLALFALLRHARERKLLLLLASYGFYANWDWRFLGLLFLSTVVDYVAGARMATAPGSRGRWRWMLLSLVANLGVLAVFKYGNFLLDSVAPLFGDWQAGHDLLPAEIPVGISFYTFQTLSYTIDIYRHNTKPCRSLLDFALFVAFFPQLVAGPIVRSTEFLPQLERVADPRLDQIASGAQRFVLGLLKKVVIADNVALFVDNVFSAPGDYGALTLWCGAYGFALQIYCDFSAYTDMALGVSRALGFRLPENFDAPYLSRSITEFWRRWHQSLSRWLRDYLYIPLGGSRKGAGRTYVNLMLTMLLGGLWHGAAWTFVLWGGVHGVMLAIERLAGVKAEPDAAAGWNTWAWVRLLFSFHVVCVTWVIFRADSFASLSLYVQRMFTAWDGSTRGVELGLSWALVLAGLMLGQYLLRAWRWQRSCWGRLPAAAQGLAMACAVVLVALFHAQDIAFIYFQF